MAIFASESKCRSFWRPTQSAGAIRRDVAGGSVRDGQRRVDGRIRRDVRERFPGHCHQRVNSPPIPI